MKKSTIIVKTLEGLEMVLAEEIADLGGENIEILTRAVSFEGDERLWYRANYELRTALRVLLPIAVFRAQNEAILYQKIQEINWRKYMTVKDTLAVDSATSSRTFRHSKYVALKVKDAIVDQFRTKSNRRPSVNVVAPTLRINVHIHDTKVTVSLDSSGDSLHKRGYRSNAVEAPINEVLAAGMILWSEWEGDCPLVDPMCGSGTIAIEAAWIATQTPPGILRASFGFHKWNNFNIDLWQEVVAAAKAKIRIAPHPIFASDKNFRAFRITEQNIANAGMEKAIQANRSKFEKLEKPTPSGVLITNPPYDERMTQDDINGFYTMIGDCLKQHWQDWTAWLISSNKEALKCVGLKTARRLSLFNGALPCKYHKYELYAGSKKKDQIDS